MREPCKGLHKETLKNGLSTDTGNLDVKFEITGETYQLEVVS